MFYRYPDLYDTLHSGFRQDVDFYLRRAQGLTGPCCELACGTGRVCRALASMGHRVLGVDLSPEMIETARAHLVKQGEIAGSCEFIEADMRDFVRVSAFDLTIIPLHSLSILLSTDDVLRCLRSVNESLVEEGSLILAVHNPDPAYLARDPAGLHHVPFQSSGATVYESSSYDTSSQVLSLRWYLETATDTRRFDFSLRMFFPQELELLLHSAGFEILERYGWYDETPLVSESGTQLVVARKRRGAGDPAIDAR